VAGKQVVLSINALLFRCFQAQILRITYFALCRQCVTLQSKIGHFLHSVAVKKQREFHVDWTTVSYRTVVLAIFAGIVSVLIALHFIFPDTSAKVTDKASEFVNSTLERWFPSKPQPVTTNLPQQARFTSFDGTVRVKKANSNTWIAADYSLPLEKGDVVQTMAEGIAKIAFADGSTYSIQPDSLITIEENATNAAQQTEVAVRLETGTFQLNTGDVPSTQHVKIDNSTTTVGKDSALQASNEARKGPPQVLMTKGTGTFEINGEQTKVAPYEKVAFNPETGEVKKEKEVAPPVLLAPANMMPLFVAAPGKPVDFSWTPVDGVRGYHIRISRNPFFSSIEKEATVSSPDWRVTGLAEGRYYWVVQSIDATGRASIESDKNGFTIIRQGNQNVSLPLDLDPFIQHGHVIEIKGKTEQNARVMVNGEQVPVVNDDGTFIYFTPPFPTGENVITITAQNEKGGVNTLTKKVVIQ
jgi:hypothetical protein